MPFLVWHTSLRSRSGRDRPCPQSSLCWSATSQKCPPITSCLSISSTTCTEPEVSRTQMRAPVAVGPLSYLAKSSLPPVPRYSDPSVALSTDIPHEAESAAARQDAAGAPSVSNLTRALAGLLPPTALPTVSHAHAAQIV